MMDRYTDPLLAGDSWDWTIPEIADNAAGAHRYINQLRARLEWLYANSHVQLALRQHCIDTPTPALKED